jgi:predicted RNase H-like HicB family nuclease
MKNIIRIDIKEYNDFTHPYFLATSPDVEGLLVEGKTVEEVVELVPTVLKNLLTATKERLEKKAAALFNAKNIILKYDYEKPFNLQLA